MVQVSLQGGAHLCLNVNGNLLINKGNIRVRTRVPYRHFAGFTLMVN